MKMVLTRRIVPAAALASLAGAAGAQVSAPPGPIASAPPLATHLAVDTGVQTVALPSGQQVLFPTQLVWKPVCSNKAPMTVNDLAVMHQSHSADFVPGAPVTIVNNIQTRAGLDLVFVLGASVPGAAVPAFAAAEAYLQGQFPGDTMTVTVTVSFAALQPGVIGGTGNSSGYVDWATARSVLVGGMDGSDTIQNSLPSGSTIPVRYSTSSTTNETRVFFSFANWKANGGTVSGNDATMQYSTNFPFDYDPSNGVTGGTMSLQDVIIHETGHALGFTSGVGFRNRDIDALDAFRFRMTDGSGDFNPDTTGEFSVRPRWAVYNNPNDDVNFDIIGAEYRMSDGSPYQASHFRQQVPAIGIMDPAFDYGETFYPTFLRTSDLTAFDAIGYDK